MRKAKIAVAACFSSHGAQVEIYTVTMLPRPQKHTYTHTHTHTECCAQTFILFEDLLNFSGFLCIFVHHTHLFYFLHNLSRQGEQNGPHKCLLNGRLGRGELYLYSRTGWVQGFLFVFFALLPFLSRKELLTCWPVNNLSLTKRLTFQIRWRNFIHFLWAPILGWK